MHALPNNQRDNIYSRMKNKYYDIKIYQQITNVITNEWCESSLDSGDYVQDGFSSKVQ